LAAPQVETIQGLSSGCSACLARALVHVDRRRLVPAHRVLVAVGSAIGIEAERSFEDLQARLQLLHPCGIAQCLSLLAQTLPQRGDALVG
jgi:hypothetical protein